tara:strand:- start:52 stop:726 length:675 start_codon:yes stop_codon:yes gene_type:complete
MTFSLVAKCEETGMFGTAVTSSSPAVAARCSYTRSGVGAVSSQNITDPSLGNFALDLLEEGLTAKEAIAKITKEKKNLEFRQILIIDGSGQIAIHSGNNSLGIFSDSFGKNVLSAGNLLANKNVTKAVVDKFEKTQGDLGDRLVSALQGGLDAGGEAGPIHSAGMQISDKVSWPIVDLRCDWSDDCPIKKLSQLWKIYKPQVKDYLQRALDPTKAPSYGVPGDQ